MSKFELNKGDNFIFCVDVSASMNTTDCTGGIARIDYLKEKVIQFVNEAAKYDEDGIDVITFGQNITTIEGVTAEKAATVIKELGANEMATQTAQAIAQAWTMHKNGGYEQTVVFVATDGEPSDRKAVEDTIVQIAASVPDDKEFNISFLTVGEIDAGLQSFLTSLDDDLGAKTGGKDIVDVKTLEEVDFISAFAGALND